MIGLVVWKLRGKLVNVYVVVYVVILYDQLIEIILVSLSSPFILPNDNSFLVFRNQTR